MPVAQAPYRSATVATVRIIAINGAIAEPNGYSRRRRTAADDAADEDAPLREARDGPHGRDEDEQTR
jgi:hypothetical protein